MNKTTKIQFLIIVSTLMINSHLFAKEQKFAGNELSSNTRTLSNGEKNYHNSCASCHGKNLTGGTGFNLTDGEWIHGGTAQNIINSIKNGFPNAGMPGFSQIYNDNQIKELAAFILSKRLGWSNLHYTVYSNTHNIDTSTSTSNNTPLKKGFMSNNLADFGLPELEDYTLRFEGDFHAPRNFPSKLWFKVPGKVLIQAQIDGKIVTRDPNYWEPAFALKKGKQRLVITYSNNKTPAWLQRKDLVAAITNDDISVKIAGISSKGKRYVEDTSFNIIADSDVKVFRRRVLKLPPSSISVGLPEKINYAFNSKNCAIVGVWRNEFLNIGPNIGGRGQDASIPLGEWVFHYPESLSIKTHSKLPDSRCKLQRYTLIDEHPVFYFTLDGNSLSVSGFPENGGIRFHYEILKSNVMSYPLKMKLPVKRELKITSNNAKVNNGVLTISDSTKKFFDIRLTQQ